MACSSATVELPPRAALPIRGHISADPRPPGTLYRDEVQRAIAAGLGYFLQRIDVRAVTRPDETGRPSFVGFEILGLRPAMDWLKFDFVPGDVITRIDGVSVEHYDAVIPMFEGLATKERFDVQLIRAGDSRSIVIKIADRAKSTASGPARRIQ